MTNKEEKVLKGGFIRVHDFDIVVFQYFLFFVCHDFFVLVYITVLCVLFPLLPFRLGCRSCWFFQGFFNVREFSLDK